jgi:hypothetical protein
MTAKREPSEDAATAAAAAEEEVAFDVVADIYLLYHGFARVSPPVLARKTLRKTSTKKHKTFHARQKSKIK